MKIYESVKYPPALTRGWAAKTSNLPNVITCQMFELCDNGVLIADSSKYNGIAESTRDALQRQRAEKSTDNAAKLLLKCTTMDSFINKYNFINTIM